MNFYANNYLQIHKVQLIDIFKVTLQAKIIKCISLELAFSGCEEDI